jgi:hypothetical protein
MGRPNPKTDKAPLTAEYCHIEASTPTSAGGQGGDTWTCTATHAAADDSRPAD